MTKRTWVWIAIGVIVLFVFWRYKVGQSNGAGGSTVGMSSQTPAA